MGSLTAGLSTLQVGIASGSSLSNTTTINSEITSLAIAALASNLCPSTTYMTPPGMQPPLFGLPSASSFKNCLDPSCSDLVKKEMERREEAAIAAIGPSGWLNRLKEVFGISTFHDTQEILRLNKNDPREKLLYLAAESDWNGALSPRYSTKEDPNDNIAQKMATSANRTVLAPVEASYADRIKVTSTEPFALFHPSNADSKRNAFKTFEPQIPSEAV